MPSIRVNYDNVFRQAARLERLGEEHRRSADALNAQRAALAGTWRDPAGAAYCQAAAQLADQMRVSADELTQLGAQIRNAAIRFKEQEEANARRAEGLTY